MTENASQPNIATIRQLLLAAFTPEELRRFCYDRPTLRPVVNRFGPGHGHDDMVDELIIYCDTNLLFPELLTELKQAKPRQYARFFAPEPPAVKADKPQQTQPVEPIPEAAPTASDSEPTTSPPIREDKKPPKVALPELTLEIPTILGPIPLHLVCVPAGEFVMGGVLAKDRDAKEDELPAHRLDLPQFHIGKYPVTNLQYHAFILATGHRAPKHWEGRGGIPRGKDDHPVVLVSWHDAVAFCDWLSQETRQPVRLPTEAEWEKAARGTDGSIYPWGDGPPDKNRCNFGDNVGDTTTIGRYSPQGDSPYGCGDIAGNVWEWCRSLYKPYPYQPDYGREDLKSAFPRVLRGGAFFNDGWGVRCTCRIRYNPDCQCDDVGFRVVVSPGPSGL